VTQAATGVALVIPAWNEPDAIGAVLEEVPPQLIDQILVVVPSAADPTADVARAHGASVVIQSTAGYGAACCSGAELAMTNGAEIIAFLDGDYADPPADLARLLEPIHDNRADLVLGCRDLRRFPDALPPHARLGNTLVCGLLRVLLRIGFRDLPSYKAIRADALRDLQLREMTYGWTVEILAKSARRGLRIEQVDVVYRPRRGGQSKVAGNLRASALAAFKLVSCALTYATGVDASGWAPAPSTPFTTRVDGSGAGGR
jgi:glycosyltransferase involved in cell wall biosynthesis